MGGRLDGKVVVVTGAASGIGLGAVERIVAEGGRAVAADIQDAKGAALEARFGGRVIYRHCDVTREDDIAAAIQAADAEWGRLDGLFNNAGIGGVMGPVESTPLDAWKATFDLLVHAVFLGVKHATPLMERSGGGSIVNTASIAGLQAGWGPLAYSTAKCAVIQFSRVAAAELCQKKIRVNAICPGLIATSIFGASLGLSRDQADQLGALVAQAGGSAQPAGRAGLPEDIAEMLVLLLSDSGSFITGAHFVIDGGITVGPRHAWDPTSPSPIAQAMGLSPDQAAAMAAGQAQGG